MSDPFVSVELHPVLAKRSKNGLTKVDIPYQPGITAKEAILTVLTENDLKGILIFVNNEVIESDRVLNNGDLVRALLPIAGGRSDENSRK